MKATSFFRVALIFPIVLPILLGPLSNSALATTLLLSLAFGGIQYVCFAIFLYIKVGRLGNAQRILNLSYWAPLFFIPVLAVGWLLGSLIWMGEMFHMTSFAVLVMLATYSLAISYAYVLVVNTLYWIFKSFGWIIDAPDEVI
ncbi:hypothetical protein ACIGHN_26945 [Acidovorax sp. NPDC077693]